jgi:hypothetical protein
MKKIIFPLLTFMKISFLTAFVSHSVSADLIPSNFNPTSGDSWDKEFVDYSRINQFPKDISNII